LMCTFLAWVCSAVDEKKKSKTLLPENAKHAS
jgi:hypothetical protein